MADIPIVKDANANVLLQVSTPVGVGFSAEQLLPDTLYPMTLTQLLTAAIEHRAATPQVQAELQHAIDKYVAHTVVDEKQVTLRSITLEQDSTATTGLPIVINGASGTGEGDSQHASRQEALVIDAQKLAPTTEIQVNNVEFAMVLGNVKVTGGAGNNLIATDTQTQSVSAGAGNDVIYANTGKHILDGGTGNDTLIYTNPGALKVYLTHNLNDNSQPYSTVLVNTSNGDHEIFRNMEAAEVNAKQYDISGLTLPGADLQNIAIASQILFGHTTELNTFNRMATQQDNLQSLVNDFFKTPEGASINALNNHDFAALVVGHALGEDPQATRYAENYLQDHSRVDLVLNGVQNEAVINHLYGAEGLWLL